MSFIACLDVAYADPIGYAAGVISAGWQDEIAMAEKIVVVNGVQPYASGQFYLRELPPLLAILKALPPPDIVVVDGYVWLDAGKPGLGAHLFEALGKTIPVVGVAKTKFRAGPHGKEVLRGASQRPLFISAAGIDLEIAAAHIQKMAGPHRLPTLLGRADQLCREAAKAGARGALSP